MAAEHPLNVDVQTEGNSTVVTLHGEVDLATVSILRDCLDEITSNSPERIVVDLAGVTFVDSIGIGVLAATYGWLGRSQSLVLRNPTASVRRTLTMAGLDSLLA